MADALPAAVYPHIVKDLETTYDTTIAVFENKAEQRFVNDHTGQKGWQFEWNLLSAADLATLQAHFDDRLGRFKSWTANDSRIGGSQTVRFNSDRLKIVPIKHKVFNVSVEVVTCR